MGEGKLVKICKKILRRLVQDNNESKLFPPLDTEW